MLYTPLFKKYYTAFIFIMLLGLPQISHGQLLGAASKDTEAPALEFAADSLGRRNPRGTVDGFLKAMGDQNYTRASQYLNLRRSVRRVSQKKKVVLAFQGLLDRGGDFYPSTLISNKPTGRVDDDLEANTDRVGTITIGEDEIDLYVENTQAADKPPLWRFTQETVDDITAAKQNSDLLVDRILPASLKERRLAGVPVGHWV